MVKLAYFLYVIMNVIKVMFANLQNGAQNLIVLKLVQMVKGKHAQISKLKNNNGRGNPPYNTKG
jgi:hypothetical protein